MSEITDRLRALELPNPERLAGKTPNCSWCGRPVDEWGQTCTHLCYDAWIRKILPRREAQGGDVWTAKTIDYRPDPEEEQTWTRPNSKKPGAIWSGPRTPSD